MQHEQIFKYEIYTHLKKKIVLKMTQGQCFFRRYKLYTLVKISKLLFAKYERILH